MKTPPKSRTVSPIELLESRIAPAVFLVNTITDDADDLAGNTDGFISLREAIIAANTNAIFGDAPAGDAAGDQILFTAIAGQTITLGNGVLTITDDLQLIGSGVKIDANNLSRVFNIDAGGGKVAMTNLTIAGGDSGAGSSGGGILINPGQNVGLVHVTVSDNVADVNGGGIFNNGGTLAIANSTISGNSANGAAIGQGGGGIFSTGTLVISNTTINNNTAVTGLGNGGGIFVATGGTLTMFGSSFDLNQAARAGGAIEVSLGTATLNNVFILRGIAGINGGGIHLSGAANVTLNGGTVADSSADQEGGGLWNSGTGTLTLVGTEVIGNVALGNGTEQGGGGIFNDGGTVTLRDVLVDGNESRALAVGNGGGGIFNDGLMTITNSTIANNIALDGSANGGGILNSDGGQLTIETSVISGNQTVRAGGGIENNGGSVGISNSTLDANFAGINGGALHTSGAGVVVIDASLVSNNRADNEGGGLWNSSGGSLVVTNSTISGNTAVFGGGVFGDGTAGVISITNSTISENTADLLGGGIATEGGGLTVINSTVSGNTTFTSGGGGLFFASGTGVIRNSTIVNNDGFLSGAGGIDQAGGSLTLTSTLLADNRLNGAAADVARTGGTLNATNSLLEIAPVGTINGTNLGNLSGTDPLLSPLDDNGGPTLTHAIDPNSPALNAGINTGLTTDQRGDGFGRLVGAGVDIGAFELQEGVARDSRFALSSGKTDRVFVFDTFTGAQLFTIDAFNGSREIKKGVTVATGDVNGDGVDDIVVGAGPSKIGPQICVFDGTTGTPINSFFAYDPSFRGGVFVAVGDIDGDGLGEIITGADKGKLDGPSVKVFDLTGAEVGSLTPFAATFTGGVRVAAGDVNGDGQADIITAPGKGAAPLVNVFDGGDGRLINSFLAFPAALKNGVFVAAGDTTGDGVAEIIAGLDKGKFGNEIRVYQGFGFGTPRIQTNTFFAFGQAFTGGVRVATGDINGDNIADILVGTGTAKVPELSIINPLNAQVIGGFQPNEPEFKGGIFAG